MFQNLFRKSSSYTQANADSELLKKANEELYKKGAELAFRNKTLSLLDKLYSVATQSIELDDVAAALTAQILAALDILNCAIVFYHPKEESFEILGYIDKNANIKTPNGTQVNDKNYFGFSLLRETKPVTLEPRGQVIGPFFAKKNFGEYLSSLGILSTLVYPLHTERGSIGLFVLGINRSEDKLSPFEREAIASAANVIAVAMDKTSVYTELKTANKNLKLLNRRLGEANRRLEELVQLKSEFLSIASHQLRTPTSIAKGMLSMVLDGTVKGAQREDFINKSFQGVMRLERIIRDLLNASELEGEKMKLECAPEDIEAIIAQVIEERKSNVDKKGLTIEFKQSKKKAPLVLMDKIKMVEVMANLIDNATNYTEKGGITIWCEQNPAGKMLNLHVKDTGIGISEADWPKLFKKFSRGERSPQINPNGSGLGLFIIKKIVEGCGGSIKVESKGVDKGSDFIVTLRTV